MNEGDMVSINADDHIAEAAEMFDAHIPVRHRELALRVEADEKSLFSSGMATKRPKLGPPHLMFSLAERGIGGFSHVLQRADVDGAPES